MKYHLLADLVVLVHLTFILFALLGGLLALWRRWLAWIHLPAAFWAAFIAFQGWICPLTPLENHFRRAAGAAGYTGGFIEHYLIPVIYPAGLTRLHQILLGVLAILINVVVYTWVNARWRRRRG